MSKKSQRRFDLYRRLESMGFSFEESEQLRRIEMTLQRWAEAECNGDIQRNESSGKPFRHYGMNLPNDQQRQFPCADRERGALARLDKIMASHPDYVSYHQSDPRGCALYIVAKKDVRGQVLDQVYNRGLAICD